MPLWSQGSISFLGKHRGGLRFTGACQIWRVAVNGSRCQSLLKAVASVTHKRERRGVCVCGEELANDLGNQRQISKKLRKYFENGDPTQSGKCSMTRSNTAWGRRRAAQLLGYSTLGSRSAAWFPDAACSWWLRAISSMGFHVWSPFSVWQLLRLLEGVTRLQARKWTQRTVARNQAEARENNKIDVQTGTSPGTAQCWQADPGCVASLGFTALDTQHQLSHMSGVTFPTVGMQPPLEQNPAAV